MGRNLNFQTVISSYRRSLILDATGSQAPHVEQQELGCKILNNFAALQRSRHQEAFAAAEEKGVCETMATQIASKTAPPFENSGGAPIGGLEMLWRGVCHEQGLTCSRPGSADGRSRRTLDKPQSPSEVVSRIVSKGSRKRQHAYGTLIILAPELEEGAERRSSTDGLLE